jgi:Ca2+-binding EF-hand superfamily protein
VDLQLSKNVRLACTVTAVLLLTGCAGHGQLSGASSVDMAFVRAAPTWDLDRDGVVTCDEWKQYAGQLFTEADSGNKGYLTREDFATLVKTDHLFEAADFAYFGGGSTGRVTRAAFVDKPNPAFRLLDKRKDCRLTSEELRLAYRAA